MSRRFSIVIVHRNGAALLRRALVALDAASDRARDEVFVVDNHSDDDSTAMVVREFPHVRLIRNACNNGFARANNQAIERARGRYVLLLNSVLTVEEGRAGAHQGKGWERFTDRVIAILNERRSHLVFMLWGGYAQRKAAFVDRRKHCVLEAPHPSPLSAHRGFLGCRHFSKANEYLIQNGQPAIDWARLD